MAYTSQFTLYYSSDLAGPGALMGQSGSMINILDACLVNGYAGKPAAGWTKPFTNSGSAGGPVYGCWKQGTGSMFTLFMSDGGYGPGGTKECWVTGWMNLTQIGPIATGSLWSGAGQGQFPTPAQQGTTGKTIWRKSADTTTARAWTIAADSSSCYIWIQTESPGTYKHMFFGDIFSLRGEADLWNCVIMGRNVENNGTDANSGNLFEFNDLIAQPAWSPTIGNWLTVAQPGNFIAANAFGNVGSINFTKRGDGGLSAVTPTALQGFGVDSCPLGGALAVPNTYDGVYYLAPIQVIEPLQNPFTLRGRFRGLYDVLHPVANFTDGQMISGSGDYAGKIFQIISRTSVGSFWGLEVTPTVETN